MAQSSFALAFINEDGDTAVLSLNKTQLQLYNFTAVSVADYESFITSDFMSLTFRDVSGDGIRLTRNGDCVSVETVRAQPWTSLIKEGPISFELPMQWFMPAFHQLINTRRSLP